MATDWVFDTVVGFLHCPIWTVPIMTFIEEKCLVFDLSEENKLVYTEIHIQYKKLVEYLLESFLDDLQIDTDVFVEACKQQTSNTPEHAMLPFEQVTAAQDFCVFKTMMVQRNIELELQALRLIQKRNGVVPESLLPCQDNTSTKVSDEDQILQEVMKQSEAEYKLLASKTSKIDKRLDLALANSKEEAERLEKEKKKEEEMMKQALNELSVPKILKKSLTEQDMAEARVKATAQVSLQSLPQLSTNTQKSSSESKKIKSTPAKASHSSAMTGPFKADPPSSKAEKPSNRPSSTKEESGTDAAANWLDSARAEAAATPSSTSTRCGPASDSAELKKREVYLKQQRDRLMAMKKKEREKSLNLYTKNESAKARPISAMAAKKATAGKVESSSSQAEDDKKMKMRLALAERLKQEVIRK